MAVDSLRDGFVKLCFDATSQNQEETCRIVLEGHKLVAGTAVNDTLLKVTSTKDLNTLFGAGSVLAESLRKALTCCGNSKVEVYALPRLNAGVNATYTMTVVGTSTTAGRVDVYWGDGAYNISVAVALGATPTVIAAAIVAAIPTNFPYTGVAAAGVITLTAKNGGTVGNNMVPQINWHGRTNYMPAGVTITTAPVVVGSGGPVALTLAQYQTILGECCVCAFALLSDDTARQAGLISYLDESWACTSPQCFGHGYVYNSGTLGTILATDTNSATLSRLAVGVTDPNWGWIKTAAYAILSVCTTESSPELSVQGPTYGVLECTSHPESCGSPFTYAEQVQLRDAGFVVSVPLAGGQGSLTSPMITNDITNSRFDSTGRANLTFQATASRRLAAATATAIAVQLAQYNGLGYFSAGTSIKQGTLGTNKRLILGGMRAWAKSEVGNLFSEFEDLDADLTFTDDFETASKCAGIPGKLAMNLVYRPPVRIVGVTVNAVPQLLNNC